MQQRPNILVLMCDQMQHNRMRFIDGIAYTPNLDALANEGIHFTHAFTSNAQCVPARCSFMTGQAPHECGVMINYGFHGHRKGLSSKHVTLGAVLKEHGYRTVYFGKSHLGCDLFDLGYQEGSGHDRIVVDDELVSSLEIEHVPDCLRSDYTVAEDAIEYLKNLEIDDQPIHFMFSTHLPHPPFFREHKYRDVVNPDEVNLPASYHSENFVGKPEFQKAHATDGIHHAPEEAEMREMICDYYSMIAKMDEQVGRIIAEFKRLGIWDNTIVLFCADHGDMMGLIKCSSKEHFLMMNSIVFPVF